MLAAALVGATGLLVWRRRAAPGANAFALLCLALATWALLYAAELGSNDLATALFWAKLEYPAIAALPLAWLAFTLRYTGRPRWLTPRNVWLLATPAILVVLLVWTNELHGLIWASAVMDASGGFPVLDVSYGPAFWGFVAYSYLLLALGTLFLLEELRRPQQLYRVQAIALVIAALAPWVGNALYLSGLSPWPLIDLTPFAFTITVLALAPGFLRFGLFDLVPLARETVIESMAMGIMVIDTRGRVVDANPAAERFMGLAPGAAVGRPVRELLGGRPDLLERYRGVSEAQSEVEIGQGDDRRLLEVRIAPIHDRRSAQAGRLVLLEEITANRRSAIELRESEQRFRMIFDSAPIGMVLVGLDYRFLQVNQALCDMLGYSNEELLSLTFVDITHPDDVAADLELAERLFKGEIPAYKMEKRYLTRDRQIVWINLTGTLVRDPDGTPRYALGMIENISERRRAEEEITRLAEDLERRVVERTAELAAANRELANEVRERRHVEEERSALLAREQEARARAEEAVRHREELLSVVSHDLKNPLTGIMGTANMLRRQAVRGQALTPEALIERLGRIDAAARKMALLINTLLDFAQLQVGQELELFVRPTDLVDLAGQVAAEQQQVTEKHEIRLETDLEHLDGEWDAFRVERTLTNLVANAIKFSPNGGPVVIRVSREQDEAGPGRWAVIEVQDQGVGIPAADLPHIFERFHRGGNVAGRIGGTGIGLASSRQIVEQHGGTISVSSQEGAGTTFTIRLPLRRRVGS